MAHDGRRECSACCWVAAATLLLASILSFAGDEGGMVCRRGFRRDGQPGRANVAVARPLAALPRNAPQDAQRRPVRAVPEPSWTRWPSAASEAGCRLTRWGPRAAIEQVEKAVAMAIAARMPSVS